MSAGYDIGVSASTSSSAAADQASAFNVTGGGKADSNVLLYVVLVLAGLVVLGLSLCKRN